MHNPASTRFPSFSYEIDGFGNKTNADTVYAGVVAASAICAPS